VDAVAAAPVGAAEAVVLVVVANGGEVVPAAAPKAVAVVVEEEEEAALVVGVADVSVDVGNASAVEVQEVVGDAVDVTRNGDRCQAERQK
jgi:hypothetical protein